MSCTHQAKVLGLRIRIALSVTYGVNFFIAHLGEIHDQRAFKTALLILTGPCKRKPRKTFLNETLLLPAFAFP